MPAIGVLEQNSGFDFCDAAGDVPGRVLSGEMAISIVPGGSLAKIFVGEVGLHSAELRSK